MINKEAILSNISQELLFVESANDNGIKPLLRLFDVAKKTDSDSITIRKFLLGCYDGSRFPFDLTEFRTLKLEVWLDCIAVLAMDRSPTKEIHEYLDSSEYADSVNGGQVFESWAESIGKTAK